MISKKACLCKRERMAGVRGVLSVSFFSCFGMGTLRATKTVVNVRLLVEGGVGEFVHLGATGTPWVVGGGCADLSLDVCISLGEVFARNPCMERRGVDKVR